MMTDGMRLKPKFDNGDFVIKDGGDYVFSGDVRCTFYKRSGAKRVVVENNDGIVHIFNEEQLRKQ